MDNLEPITRNEMFLNGDDLEPITREEMILAGADLEPITRHEWFLKRYRGGGGGGGYDLVNVPNLPADIASFNDGTDLPMASLKVAVTPYQDLHGYDAPWAGGAGKNKFDIEGWLNRSGATYTKSGNTYTITATSALFGTPFTFSDTDVAISASASSYVAGTATFIRMQLLDSNNSVVDELVANNSYQKRENVVASKVRFNWSTGGTFTITEPQVELGSTATSYAPYSNICPIIGWDEAVVTVADDVENPTTSHEYTIDLDGTRYGGVLDATNGTMTVDRVYVDLGDLNWTYINGFFRTTDLNATIKRPANNNTKANVISSMYTVETWNAITNTDNGKFALSAGATDPLLVCNTSYTDATAFKTAMAGQKIVYELATPLTVQLTPTQVKSLEGVNNINANCGQITEVKYFKKA